MRKGGDRFEDRGWWAEIVDKARSGLAFRKFKVGRAAGLQVCVSPAVGTFAELDARDDIKSVNGAMGVVTDVGSWGSNWVVINGVWRPDGDIVGFGSPEGVVAAPVGSEYVQVDAGPGKGRHYKATGTGNTGWTTDALGALAGIVDPTRDFGAVLDGNTDCTAAFQQAQAAAKQAAPGNLQYGKGGKVRMRVGVAVIGAVTWSRWVTLEGTGALGSSVLRAGYADRTIDGVPTPGEDAMFTMLNDGSQQGGIVGQQKFHNIALDGRRSTLVGGPLETHIRHGLYYPDPGDGSDRICSVGDLHIMNFPGSAWKVTNNGQVRGGNFKATGNKKGLDWAYVKDGKFDQVGLSNDGGSSFFNCASVKIGTIDTWSGGNSDGSPVLTIESCAKFVIDRGEVEGMVDIIGDNNLPASKAYRQVLMNELACINFKVSEDYANAKGPGDPDTGEGYVAHVRVLDAYGTQLPNCSFGFKLGVPTSGMLAARPPFALWFGTRVPDTDPDYDDFLASCSYCDVHTTKFLWHDGYDGGSLHKDPIVAFWARPSSDDALMHGYRVGMINERLIGSVPTDEFVLDGSPITSRSHPLLYCALTYPTGKLTDRDASGPGADPDTGYKTINVPDLETGNVETVKTMVYKQ